MSRHQTAPAATEPNALTRDWNLGTYRKYAHLAHTRGERPIEHIQKTINYFRARYRMPNLEHMAKDDLVGLTPFEVERLHWTQDIDGVMHSAEDYRVFAQDILPEIVKIASMEGWT
jgi:hypothetical protein